jgi:hypothetical protein
MMSRLLVATAKRVDPLAKSLGLTTEMVHPFFRMVSRLSYKPDFFNHKLSCEFIPDLLKLDKRAPDWRDCCLERARDILKKYPGKIYLSWSGGIDSTTLVSSMLEIASDEDRKRLVIVLSHHSVLENPSYFEKYLLKFSRLSILEDLSPRLLEEDAVLVTGELGDQLFGSDFLLNADFKKSYQDSVPEMIGRTAFERLQPIVNEAPFPIRTTHDFFWWFNFTQKWQFVKFRAYEHTTWNLQATYGKNLLHFFDTVDFQLWSLQNHDLKHRGDWSTYKAAAKDFLFEITNDPAQLSLQKYQSLEKTYLVSENRIAIDEEGKVVNSLEELAKYVH